MLILNSAEKGRHYLFTQILKVKNMTSVKEKVKGIREKTAEMQAGAEELSRKNEAAVKQIQSGVREIQKGMEKKTKEMESGVDELIRENEAAVEKMGKGVKELQKETNRKTEEMEEKIRKTEESGKRFVKEFYG